MSALERRPAAGRAWEQVRAQLAAQRLARRPAAAFLAHHRRQLPLVRLGATFSPEHCHALLLARGVRDAAARHEQALRALDFVQGPLGIRDIRLPLRWNRAVAPEGRRLDMRFYDPYLDQLIRRQARLCLNVGPIKAARWPECHLPDWLPPVARAIPPPGSIVRADSELAAHAREHLHRLLDHLAARYSPAELARVALIQPENEPFSYFGARRLFLGADYMRSLIAIVRARVPAAKVLVNAMGMADARDFRRGVSHVGTIARLFADVVRRDPASRGRLVSGFDYYHYATGMPSVPRFGAPDQVTLTNVRRAGLIEANQAAARAVGFEVEVTEGQMEPWGSAIPGNSAEHLRFVLGRCLTVVDARAASTVRLWGVERLAVSVLTGEATPAQRAMCATIAAVNALSLPAGPADPPR